MYLRVTRMAITVAVRDIGDPERSPLILHANTSLGSRPCDDDRVARCLVYDDRLAVRPRGVKLVIHQRRIDAAASVLWLPCARDLH